MKNEKLERMTFNVIRKFGLEHPITISFFHLMEHERNIKVLCLAYDAAMAMDVFDEEPITLT